MDGSRCFCNGAQVENMKRLQNVRILLGFAILLTSLWSLEQEKVLVDTERAFRIAVEQDATLFDKKLVLSRYDLIRRLLAADRTQEALQEISELRSEYSGKSLAWLDYLAARLHLRFGVEAQKRAGPLRQVFTNWLPASNFSSGGLRPAEQVEEVLPLARLASFHFLNAGKNLDRLRLSSLPALREAAELARADLAWATNRNGNAAWLIAQSFLDQYPKSSLVPDACFRLSMYAAAVGSYDESIGWLERLRDGSRAEVWNDLTEERIQNLRAFRERKDRVDLKITAEDQLRLIEGFETELALKQDLAVLFDHLAQTAKSPVQP